jgi:hypothetical protein
MSSYAFIETVDGTPGGDEIKRLCATDESRPLKLLSGDEFSPSGIVVGSLLRLDGYTLRVDNIVVTA